MYLSGCCRNPARRTLDPRALGQVRPGPALVSEGAEAQPHLLWCGRLGWRAARRVDRALAGESPRAADLGEGVAR